jgi:hypothetical protein
MRKILLSLILIGVLAGANLSYAGTVTAGPQSVALTASQGESMTLSLSTNSLTIPLGAAAGTYSSPITANVAWNIASGHVGTLTVGAWFSSASAALNGGTGGNLPSSSFTLQATINGATLAPTVCNQPTIAAVSSVAGATCIPAANAVVLSNLTTASQGTLTDTYALAYTGALAPPATYTGTFYIDYVIQ